jgi:hypothetical protein
MKELYEDYGKPANYSDELNHMESGLVPMTNKIGGMVFGNFRITTFHVTDIAGISGIQKMVSEKMAISSFTYMNHDTIKNLRGVRTDGGVLFQLEGRTLYEGNSNLVSYPDNRGKKWLGCDTVFPHQLSSQYRQMVRDYISRNKPSAANRRYGDNDKKPLDVVKYIAGFIMMVEEFIGRHRKEVRDKAINGQLSSSWNEILIHEIVVKNVLWTTTKASWIHDFKELKRKREQYGRDSLTENERLRIRDYVNTMDDIESQLREFCDGEILHTDVTENALMWMARKGGYVDFDKHRENMRLKQQS